MLSFDDRLEMRSKGPAGTVISDSAYKQFRTILFVLAAVLFALVAIAMFVGMGKADIIQLMPVLPFLVVTGMMYLSVHRLWKVQIHEDRLIAQKGKSRVEFRIGNIRKIELVPNWWQSRNTERPFTLLTLHHSINGVQEIRYISADDQWEEQLLINPWKKLVHERANAIHKSHYIKK